MGVNRGVQLFGLKFWRNQKQQQEKRLQTLKERFDTIQAIRRKTVGDVPYIETLSVRKIWIKNPNLATQYNAFLKEQQRRKILAQKQVKQRRQEKKRSLKPKQGM